jgi:hypothetical protein
MVLRRFWLKKLMDTAYRLLGIQPQLSARPTRHPRERDQCLPPVQRASKLLKHWRGFQLKEDDMPQDTQTTSTTEQPAQPTTAPVQPTPKPGGGKPGTGGGTTNKPGSTSGTT